MKIVPALLTDSLDELKHMHALMADCAELLQIDFMDERFVPTKSVPPVDLISIPSSVPREAHLMVLNPEQEVAHLKSAGFMRVLFHHEATDDPLKVIKEIKAAGMQAGVAINPQTPIEQVGDYWHQLDSLLLLSVDPGKYGSPFIPEVLSKLKQAVKESPSRLSIGIDGGIKENNVVEIIKMGLDYVCVGSAILKTEDPHREYNHFVNLAKQYAPKKGSGFRDRGSV